MEEIRQVLATGRLEPLLTATKTVAEMREFVRVYYPEWLSELEAASCVTGGYMTKLAALVDRDERRREFIELLAYESAPPVREMIMDWCYLP